MSQNVGSVFVEVRADLTKLREDLAKVQSEVSGLGKKLETSVSGGGSGKSNKLFKGIEKGAKRASLASGVSLAALLKVGAEYDRTMRLVKALSNATNEEMAVLSSTVKKLGQESAFTSRQVAEGALSFVKAGAGIKDVVNGALEAAVDLAVSTNGTLIPAVDAVNDSMRNFNLRGDEMRDTVDNISGAVNQSKFTLTKYQHAAGQAAAIAGDYGFTLRDFAVAIAATSKAFRSGSDAGTSFKNFLGFLVPKSADAAKLMAELNVQFFDSTGKMKSLTEIAETLKQKFSGLNDEQRLLATKKVFGTDAFRTAIELSKLGAEGIEEFSEKLGSIDSGEVAKSRMEGMAGATEKFTGAIENLSIAVAESGLMGVATEIIEVLAAFVEKLGRLPQPILVATGVVVGLTTALAPLAISLALIVPLFAGITAAGVVVAAKIAAVATAAYLVYRATNDLAKILVKVFIELFKKIIEPIQAVINFTNMLQEAIRSFGSMGKRAIISFYNIFKEYMHDKFMAITGAVKSAINSVTDAFYDMYDKVVGNSYVPDMVDEVSAQFDRLDTEMVEKSKSQTAAVSKNFESMASDVSGSLEGIAEAASQVNNSQVTTAGGAEGADGGGSGGGILDSITGGLKSVFGDSIGGAVGGVVGKTADLFGGNSGSGTEAQFESEMGRVFTGVFRQASQYGVDKITGGSNDASSVLNNLLGRSGALDKLGSGLAGAIGGLMNGGSSGRGQEQASGAPMQTINFNMPEGTTAESFRQSAPQMASVASGNLGRAGRIY